MRSPDEADALANLNCQEFSRHLPHLAAYGGVSQEQDGALFCASSSTFPVLFNIAWRTDPTSDAGRFTAAASEWFGSMGRGWSVMLREQPVDGDLREAVDAAGLVPLLNAPAMNVESFDRRGLLGGHRARRGETGPGRPGHPNGDEACLRDGRPIRDAPSIGDGRTDLSPDGLRRAFPLSDVGVLRGLIHVGAPVDTGWNDLYRAY